MTARRKRACVVRQHRFPLDPRVRREVAALAEAGFDVDVVCARGPGEPSFERNGDVTVWRLPITKRRGHPLRYLFEYAAFFAAATIVVTALHVVRRFRVVQVNTLPDALVFCTLPARLLGARVVLDLHEPMPEFFATKFGLPTDHRLTRLVASVEQGAIRYADAAITPSNQLRDRFVERGADPAKVTAVLNGADDVMFDPDRFPSRPDDGRFRLVCHGSVEERYGIDTIIEAVALLAPDLPGMEARIYGDGSYLDELRALAQEKGVADRVWFSGGFVPDDELVRGIAEADLGVVAIKKDAFRDLVLCLKLYDFMAMGKPVVASRTRSVEETFGSDCLPMFDSEDAEGLAIQIRKLAENADERARVAAAAASVGRQHQWSEQRRRYLDVVAGL